MGSPRPPQRHDQGAGHGGGRPRDRGAHRAGRERQRDAAVLRRALRAGDRGLPARPRATGRTPARRSAGSPRWRRSSSRASTPRPMPQLPPDSPLRGRIAIANAHARLRPLPRALRRAALGAPRRARCAPAASALGEHRDEEPRLLRRALRRAADRPGRRQHHAGADAPRLSPITERSSTRSTRTPTRPSAFWRGRGGRARPATAHDQSSSARASRRSVASYDELLDCIESKLALRSSGT